MDHPHHKRGLAVRGLSRRLVANLVEERLVEWLSTAQREELESPGVEIELASNEPVQPAAVAMEGGDRGRRPSRFRSFNAGR